MEMYSDILRILDRNTERNMVTDLQGVVDELKDEKRQLLIRDRRCPGIRCAGT